MHTVGAEIFGERVPESCVDLLNEVSSLLPEQARQELVSRLIALFREIGTKTLTGVREFNGGLTNSSGSNFETRFQPDYAKIATVCEAMRITGHEIALTMGTFDIIHIGHASYIEAAARCGDFLVVGVDSDSKVTHSKGPSRPIVNQDERLQMLAHLRGVDLVTLKERDDPKWHLIKTVMPDTLVATEGTYTDVDRGLLGDFVGRVVVLPPQSTTSTTARLRKLQIDNGADTKSKLLSNLSDVGLDDVTLGQVVGIINATFEDR
jgi:D-glycero-beta-D-manno-heptose 1-phosphate adenylyltransferase